MLTEKECEKIYYESRLREQLVPAKLKELKIAMNYDPDLKKLLITPAKNLPERYRFLITEITPDLENNTLLNVIRTAINYNFRGTKTVSYFSKAGEKFVGFVAYIVSNNEVIEIKMFSFLPEKSGIILIRDLKLLLDDLTKKYSKICWSALKNNPANRIYEKAIIRYHGNPPEENNGIIHYCIENIE